MSCTIREITLERIWSFKSSGNYLYFGEKNCGNSVGPKDTDLFHLTGPYRGVRHGKVGKVPVRCLGACRRDLVEAASRISRVWHVISRGIQRWIDQPLLTMILTTLPPSYRPYRCGKVGKMEGKNRIAFGPNQNNFPSSIAMFAIGLMLVSILLAAYPLGICVAWVSQF